jgi:hypothetical protein
MNLNILKQQSFAPVQLLNLSSFAPEPQEASFHASLKECENAHAEQPLPRKRFSLPLRPWAGVPQGRVFNALARVWSSLQSKYTFSATKRLRVSETVSLGEKRFVALVNVEGREFLVGGGASGVSLLAEWEKPRESVEAPRRRLTVRGNFK